MPLSEPLYRELPVRYQKYPDDYNECPLCGGLKHRNSRRCANCRKEFRPSIQQPSDPSYRLIALTHGQVALVDAADYDGLMQSKWFADWSPNTRSFYAVRSIVQPNGKRTSILMHRQILGLGFGDPRQGDHAFHNTLDNRRCIDGKENLRIATHAENQHNHNKQRNSTSGFKNVYFHKSHNKYMAQLQVNGTHKFLGYRDTAEAAYRELYLPAAKIYHGKFAKAE